ncbi:MAG: helix-turn-helix domain-containing protein [Aliiglaciecola sp.]|uniref:winged helix-turn-helix transcriptional regulator n=1 Tax=Aliiglaciecola sp. M165 TaxID=2593649 RepID=UPI00163DB4FF|nr:helix-turn-helix domain-containing protein [Aliiglaciecola sp. M165]
MAAATQILSDKWTLLIIREAFYGVVRFDDIRKDIGIPKAVLSNRLKKLVEQGILQKVTYQLEGERTRSGYVLTGKGRDLTLVFVAMMDWGNKHCLDGKSAVTILDKNDLQTLKLGLIGEKDFAQIRGLEDIHIRLKL